MHILYVKGCLLKRVIFLTDVYCMSRGLFRDILKDDIQVMYLVAPLGVKVPRL